MTRRSDEVLFERSNGYAKILLNRPEAHNTINQAMLKRMIGLVKEVEKDHSIKLLVITGSGERAFCAGADISEFKATPKDIAKFIKLGQSLVKLLMKLPKVSLALVNGVAFGGGCEIALACDVRISTENAKFGQPEPNLGIMPGWGATYNLPRLVGASTASELLLTGKIIDAQEADRIGLVSRVIPASYKETEIKELADHIATLSPVAIRKIKETLAETKSLDRSLSIEFDKFMECYSSTDRKEGVKAFLEKRKPHFK